jgi:hypothetical protein
MEPESSLPYSQELSSGPYSEPDESSSNPPPNFPKIHYNIIFLSISRSSELSLTFRFSDQNFVCISHLPHAWPNTSKWNLNREEQSETILEPAWWGIHTVIFILINVYVMSSNYD